MLQDKPCPFHWVAARWERYKRQEGNLFSTDEAGSFIVEHVAECTNRVDQRINASVLFKMLTKLDNRLTHIY